MDETGFASLRLAAWHIQLTLISISVKVWHLKSALCQSSVHNLYGWQSELPFRCQKIEEETTWYLCTTGRSTAYSVGLNALGSDQSSQFSVVISYWLPSWLHTSTECHNSGGRDTNWFTTTMRTDFIYRRCRLGARRDRDIQFHLFSALARAHW